MSTPPGKPINPIDLSAYVSQKARERTEAAASDDDSRSPYAPKRPHERAGVPPVPAESAHDPQRSPYAPKAAHAPTERDFEAGEEVEPRLPLGAPEGFRARPAEDRYGADRGELGAREVHSPSTAFDEGAAAAHPVDLDEAAASLQPSQAASHGRPNEPPSQRDDEVMNERDLERLEASLRWLQRQDATTRLNRAPQLPPVAGLAPLDARARRQGGEMRPPLSLEPERLPPPPLRSTRDNMRWPLRILIASSVVAPVAYYLLAGGWSSSSEPTAGLQTASTERPNATSPSVTVQQLWPTRAQDDDQQGSQIVPNRIKTQPERSQPQRPPPEASRGEPPQPAKSPARDAVAMLQPAPSALPTPQAAPALSAAPAPQAAPAAAAPSAALAPAAVPAPPAPKAARVLAADEIALLVKQGEQFIAAGDLVTARTVFQRAAEAGDASAAVALGATYDPIVLAKLGVVGISPDVEKARSWYQRAESLGSPEARRRLEVLATR